MNARVGFVWFAAIAFAWASCSEVSAQSPNPPKRELGPPRISGSSKPSASAPKGAPANNANAGGAKQAPNPPARPAAPAAPNAPAKPGAQNAGAPAAGKNPAPAPPPADAPKKELTAAEKRERDRIARLLGPDPNGNFVIQTTIVTFTPAPPPPQLTEQRYEQIVVLEASRNPTKYRDASERPVLEYPRWIRNEQIEYTHQASRDAAVDKVIAFMSEQAAPPRTRDPNAPPIPVRSWRMLRRFAATPDGQQKSENLAKSMNEQFKARQPRIERAINPETPTINVDSGNGQGDVTP